MEARWLINSELQVLVDSDLDQRKTPTADRQKIATAMQRSAHPEVQARMTKALDSRYSIKFLEIRGNSQTPMWVFYKRSQDTVYCVGVYRLGSGPRDRFGPEFVELLDSRWEDLGEHQDTFHAQLADIERMTSVPVSADDGIDLPAETETSDLKSLEMADFPGSEVSEGLVGGQHTGPTEIVVGETWTDLTGEIPSSTPVVFARGGGPRLAQKTCAPTPRVLCASSLRGARYRSLSTKNYAISYRPCWSGTRSKRPT